MPIIILIIGAFMLEYEVQQGHVEFDGFTYTDHINVSQE